MVFLNDAVNLFHEMVKFSNCMPTHLQVMLYPSQIIVFILLSKENLDLGPRSFFPDSLSAHFLSMDRYCSIAHFADFQVCSSLNRSKKTSGLLLEKSAKTLDCS